MNKTLIVLAIIISFLLIFGGRVVRNTLIETLNKRLDSSEAVLINEIDARIYRDFHEETPIESVEVTPESIQYVVGNDVVRLSNNEDSIQMDILYADGGRWKGSLKGSIEVAEVEVVNINDQYKVDLSNTDSRLYAITYQYREDWQNNRVSMNRNFTRYLIIP